MHGIAMFILSKVSVSPSKVRICSTKILPRMRESWGLRGVVLPHYFSVAGTPPRTTLRTKPTSFGVRQFSRSSRPEHTLPLAAAGMDTPSSPLPRYNVALVGLGSIGVSFAALHLRFGTGTVTVCDTRPDLHEHVTSVLPGYLGTDAQAPKLADLLSQGRLSICSSLEEACASADIVQEQGPENLAFKRSIWSKIESCAPEKARFWSSTSGIAASAQSEGTGYRGRLLVVHPFNPPHILPLVEIVPSPETRREEVDFARGYFEALGSGHRPVVINKELPGFVGNRIAFTVLREAAYLVKEDVVSVGDIDAVIEASLGPRFAVQGPFKAYHMGGGSKGIRGFLDNLGTTIQEVWDSGESVDFKKDGEREAWVDKVIKQTEETYGMPTVDQLSDRDRELRRVLGK